MNIIYFLNILFVWKYYPIIYFELQWITFNMVKISVVVFSATAILKELMTSILNPEDWCDVPLKWWYPPRITQLVALLKADTRFVCKVI